MDQVIKHQETILNRGQQYRLSDQSFIIETVKCPADFFFDNAPYRANFKRNGLSKPSLFRNAFQYSAIFQTTSYSSFRRLCRFRTLPCWRSSFSKSRSRSTIRVISVLGVASAAMASWGNAKSDGVKTADLRILNIHVFDFGQVADTAGYCHIAFIFNRARLSASPDPEIGIFGVRQKRNQQHGHALVRKIP